MITRSNYEEVFVDYFDGKLDKIRQEDLFSFLSTNPDLQEEFNHYSDIQTLPDLKISFKGKDKLKKNTITIYNYKTWLVGYIENDLLSEQKKEVDTFLLKNLTLKRELEILKLSHLVPDRRIVFYKKNTLKKSAKIIIFTPTLKRTLSIAAALILFTLTYFIIHQLNNPKSEVSDKRENKQNNVIINNKYDLTQTQSNTKKSDVPKNFTPNKNKKTDNLKDKNEKVIELLLANEVKEIKDSVIPDTLNFIQIIENTKQLTEQKNLDTINSQEMTSNQDRPIFHTNQMSLDKRNLSDIFSDEELKDLGLDLNNNKEKSNTKNKTLFDLASNELKKISKSTDVSVEKQKNILSNSVTYALGIGKNFSISHTVSQ